MPEAALRTGPEPWEYCLYVPNDPRAVTVSRRTLRLILTMHGLIRLVDVAELLAAELISNAVRHTKGPPRCDCAGRRGCCGSARGTPTRRRPSRPCRWNGWRSRMEDGRGLALVMACADVWGWQPLSTEGNCGKVVWCELGAA